MTDNTKRRFRSLGDQDGRLVQRALGQLNQASSDDSTRRQERGALHPSEPERPAPLRPLTDEFRPAAPPRRKDP